MPVATITKNNLSNGVWQNIYNVVETVTDPSSRGVQWVFSSFPESRKGTAAVYPVITIDTPTIDGQNVVMGHSVRQYKWSVPISIYHTRAGTVDALTSNVLATIESSKATLESAGMNNISLDASPDFTNVIEGQIVHEKRVTITCETVV